MKLGIVQPYFMPYIGYWQLMNAVDKYVLCDNIEYTENVTENVLENVLENVPENVPENVTENVLENVPEKLKRDILGDLRGNSKITMSELANKYSVDIKTIKRDIEALKQKGLIARVGPDKGGYWQVVEQTEK